MQLDELLRAEVASQSVDHEAATVVVDEVIAKGRRRLRRRKITAAVAAAITVAIAASASALLINTEPGSSGFIRPRPTSSTSGPGLSARQLRLADRVAQDAAVPGPGPSQWPINVGEADAVLSDRSTATMQLMNDVTAG